MAKEIERKFLVKQDFPKTRSEELSQGYIGAPTTIRVRIAGKKAFLTLKGPTEGISRDEWEYEIPVADARNMMKALVKGPLVEKTRYHVDHDGKEWVIDEFHGDNLGLVVAEIELGSESESFTLPDWAGEEVTKDLRYANSHLAKKPFNQW